ncbi:MAG: LysM peptidoglycan-binding domain-containing protein [Microbacterium sp.]
MSTIALASAPRTRLRLTVRGRRAVAAVAAVPVVAGILIGAISGGAALASRDAGAPEGTFETVTVQPGDTLWGIATEVAPNEDPREVIDAITSLNNLTGTLTGGETLAIPLEYASTGPSASSGQAAARAAE